MNDTKKQSSRIYVVRDMSAVEGDGVVRLVEATSASQAIRHVAQRYRAAPATAKDVALWMSKDVRVEQAGEK